MMSLPGPYITPARDRLNARGRQRSRGVDESALRNTLELLADCQRAIQAARQNRGEAVLDLDRLRITARHREGRFICFFSVRRKAFPPYRFPQELATAPLRLTRHDMQRIIRREKDGRQLTTEERCMLEAARNRELSHVRSQM